eukprot:s3561_g7.t1
MFAAADMKSLLRYMAEESPCFLEMLKHAAMPLKFILSHDETTAGNVVSTEARLKATMFYGTFTAFATIIDSPHAWIPLAVLSRDQMSRVQGGMAAVHKIFIEDFAAQSLDTSFEVAPGCHIQVQFAIMIADMDGQGMALCSKGSAALKPCSFCIDCVCKDAAGAQNDLRFKTIAEPDISFLKLGQCAECLRRIGQLKNYDDLEKYQREHHTLFQCAYPQALRPKHHHRLHLPEQYRSMQTVASCWGTEAKHKDYKSVFSTVVQHFLTEKAGGSEFSQQLLPRLLNRHCQLLNETPFSSKGFLLQNAFDASAVELATGLHGCRLAGQCRVNMLDLKEKDVILWNYPDYSAGIINFFIEEHNQLFVPLTLCQHTLSNAEALLSFQTLNERAVVQWSHLLAKSHHVLAVREKKPKSRLKS